MMISSIWNAPRSMRVLTKNNYELIQILESSTDILLIANYFWLILSSISEYFKLNLLSLWFVCISTIFANGKLNLFFFYLYVRSVWLCEISPRNYSKGKIFPIFSVLKNFFPWSVVRLTFHIVRYNSIYNSTYLLHLELLSLNQQFNDCWSVYSILDKTLFLSVLSHSVWVKYLEPCLIYLKQLASAYCYL